MRAPHRMPLRPSGTLILIIPKMSTSILRSVAAAALTGSFVFTAAAQTLPSQATVLAEAGKVADYWIAHDPWLPGVASHNWTGSTLMNGYLALFEMDGNQKYFNYASTWATHYSYTLNGSDTDTFCDHYACGETFFILYKLTGSNDSTKIRHIKADIDYQTGLGSGGYKFWGFVDALNQGGPSFALVSVLENSSAVSEHMYQMYLHLKTTANSGLNLWNTTDHLWYRDTSQKSPKQYWSRGDGWAVLMHAKMLQTLPPSDPHYAEYVSTFQQQMAALIKVQRSDGLWNVDLANPNNFPGPESTGSACFMYGLAYGIRTGILDSATYMPALVKVWNGFVNVCIHPDNGMLGYIQGTGSSPSSRQPVNYNNTNVNHTGGDNRDGDFGYGLFLLGAAEVARLAGGSPPPVAAPVFNPPGGTYPAGSTQMVGITSSTSGASIRYTTDGSTPSETAGTLYSGSPVPINTHTVLQAIAYESGMADSTVTSATYDFEGPQVGLPTFSPAAGSYATAQSVTITSSTSGASIRYTTDGSTPSETAGTLYSGPVNISKSATLKAIAYEVGFADSAIASGAYTIGSPQTLNFEAESLSFTGSGATTSVQTDSNSSGGKWVELAGNSTGDHIDFTVPNIPAGTYQLKMEWKGNNNRGILQLAVDGANVGSTLDQYASGQTYPTTTFGNVTFSAVGNHTVRLTVTGKNSASSGEVLSADKFTFIGQ